MIELDVLSAADLARDEDAQAAHGRPRPWRSWGDRTDAPGHAALRHNEFPSGPETDGEASRRTFLKVMGASVALAGLSGCRRPAEPILPYARKPQEVVPGLPNYYATAMPLGGVGHPLLVQSHEGRPTKVEGNPEHPVTLGASDVFAQASVLQLYDPDRSRAVTRQADGESVQADWGLFLGEANRMLTNAAAERVTVLAEPTSSLTLLALRDRFLQTYPNGRWITLGPHLDDYAALGTQLAFGRPARPLYRFSNADVVVSFDADFLTSEDPNSVWNSREYAASRRVDERGSMSRTYVVESTMTTTGGIADHRLRMKAGQIPFFAASVANVLGVGTGVQTALPPEAAPMINAIVSDVRAAGGRAAFVAGLTQPPQVHALVAALNARYGAGVVTYLDTEEEATEAPSAQIEALVREMGAGAVDTLVMLGTNPVYTLPADLGFVEALARVPRSVHVGLYRDESGQRTAWHLPSTHYLESWGDVRAYDGTISVIQPLIAPLYADAHSEIEVVNALVTGRNNAGYDLVRQTMQGRLGGVAAGGFESAWRTVLHDGFVADTGYAPIGAGAGGADLSGLRPPPEDAVELVFRLSPTLYDGRFANVAWLQEAPHPVTKVTWDPTAVMSQSTARKYGLKVEDEGGKSYASIVRLTAAGGVAAEMPVWIQPGHPDDSVTVYLGYGRQLATDKPRTERGFLNRLALRDSDLYDEGPIANGVYGPAARVEPLRLLANTVVLPGVAVERADDGYLVATTQDHGSMEGRAIVRSATLAEYRAEPEFAKEEHLYIEDTPWDNYEPLWGDENSAAEDPRIGEALYSENQWGMTIDLNACSGCNACLVACQSENNVPVVGKDQVARGREMHWLRLDRYYVGDAAEPGMVVQPMFCVHCENAPCEQVCPVNATSHSPDGINEMTYNRCIGTRYCSNNCPYKVRRYNFYNWNKTLPLEVQMAYNPYVTVRYRGVMEKCTFCVQRVRLNQQYAHIENRPLRDGDVQTACQQACAADAIVFGDLRDPDSAVTRSKQNARNYGVLAELATKPRVTYLARLRNPHPDLATPFDAADRELPVAEPHAEAAA